ncbi:MAG: hypothetical protein HY661_08420 [Betaproteobacteria bacterium]|nr:hypothetical protein [Betaproteobacteria bacterium]
MADRRLLYLTGNSLAAYAWKNGALSAEGIFDTGADGVAAFGSYVANSPGALYYLLADVVEEDFFQENIPYVRGRDRATLMARKLAQRYRDTTLAMALTIGLEAGARREERVLYCSFTNTQQFQPWLAALKQHEARLVGVYSIALLAPQVGKSIGIGLTRYVLVSLQEGGLRQTYIDGGNIRFSRLGHADATDPHAVAAACAAESERIQQFLVNLRMLSRDAPPLDVVILAPRKHYQDFASACVDSVRLKFQIRDLEVACKTAGLKSAPRQMLAERLFLQVLAGTQPAQQFAADALRRFYYVWRARLAMIAAGAAVCGFCLLFSGLKLVDIYGVRQLHQTDMEQTLRATQEYERLQASFPKTPLSREDLKASVEAFRAIEKQSTGPEALLVEISQALSSLSQIEVERMNWDVTSSPRGRQARDSAKAAPPAAPGAPGAKTEAIQMFEVAEVSATIQAVNVSDYRAINLLVGQFVDALRARPGIEVATTRMPFELSAERALSGDIGTERKSEVPRFSVVVTRRLGS